MANPCAGKLEQPCWPCSDGIAWVGQVAYCSRFPSRLVTIKHFFYLADGVETIAPGHPSVQSNMRAYADVSIDEFVSTADGHRFFKNPDGHSSAFVPVDEIQLIPEGTVRNFCSANGEETEDFCIQATFLGRPPELTLQLLVFGDDVNLRGY